MIDFGISALWKKGREVVAGELRANTSPLRVSLSIAVGIFVGLSPFYGLHTVIVIVLAFLLRCNRPIALAASCITLLPFVPLWIAAGIFAGKLVAPIQTVSRLIDLASGLVTSEHFWGITAWIVRISRRFLPPDVFNKVDEEAGHGIIDGFVQWFIGCSVLAAAGGLVSFAVCYYILLRRAEAMKRKPV